MGDIMSQLLYSPVKQAVQDPETSCWKPQVPSLLISLQNQELAQWQIVSPAVNIVLLIFRTWKKASLFDKAKLFFIVFLESLSVLFRAKQIVLFKQETSYVLLLKVLTLAFLFTFINLKWKPLGSTITWLYFCRHHWEVYILGETLISLLKFFFLPFKIFRPLPKPELCNLLLNLFHDHIQTGKLMVTVQLLFIMAENCTIKKKLLPIHYTCLGFLGFHSIYFESTAVFYFIPSTSSSLQLIRVPLMHFLP